MLVFIVLLACDREPAVVAAPDVPQDTTGSVWSGGGETGRGQHDTAPVETYTGGLTAVSGGALVSDGDTLSLGSVPIGVGTLDGHLTLTNTTEAEMALSFSLDGEGFSWAETPPAVLAAGASSTLALRFTPGASVGEQGGQLVVSDKSTSFSVWLLGMLQAARPSWQDTLLKRLVQLLVLVWALRFLRSAGYLRSALEFLLSLA